MLHSLKDPTLIASGDDVASADVKSAGPQSTACKEGIEADKARDFWRQREQGDMHHSTGGTQQGGVSDTATTVRLVLKPEGHQVPSTLSRTHRLVSWMTVNRGQALVALMGTTATSVAYRQTEAPPTNPPHGQACSFQGT